MAARRPIFINGKDPVLKQLQVARANRYRQSPQLRISTEAEALDFLNDVGLCSLFSAKGVELPSLWGALCGEVRPLPQHQNSPELGRAWQWKDTLPIAGHVLYGKFLRKRPVFISLDLAPNFYALSPNYGDLAEDYLQDYLDGRLSVEAKLVYEALLGLGALPTSRLRREAGLAGKANASRFERALTELQMDFRIVKVAISDANRWGYCYVYDLFPRRFPGIVETSRTIKGRQAREVILLRYLRTVIAATPQQIGRVLGWTRSDIEHAACRLASEGQLYAGVHVEGLSGEYLVSRD
jgi:hypothetical protein